MRNFVVVLLSGVVVSAIATQRVPATAAQNSVSTDGAVFAITSSGQQRIVDPFKPSPELPNAASPHSSAIVFDGNDSRTIFDIARTNRVRGRHVSADNPQLGGAVLDLDSANATTYDRGTSASASLFVVKPSGRIRARSHVDGSQATADAGNDGTIFETESRMIHGPKHPNATPRVIRGDSSSATAGERSQSDGALYVVSPPVRAPREPERQTSR